MKHLQMFIFVLLAFSIFNCSTPPVPEKKTVPDIDKEEVPAPAKPAPLPTPKKK